MSVFRKVRRYIYKNSSVLRRWWFLYQFLITNKYWPDFRDPKTYNEKVNYRKMNSKHELFSICSDKILAKEWVAGVIGRQYVIKNYYVGDCISPQVIRDVLNSKGDCLLKANHNSGPVKLLTTESTDQEIDLACKDVNAQLKIDFGKKSNEPWYSEIKPRVLLEQRLEPEEGESDVRDYKFHVFRQIDGQYKIFVAIDFDRSTNHNRSFFDQNFKYLRLSTKCPSIITAVDKPDNYELMLELAKKLAEPFSYVRVDFYNIKGRIFFGEMTFAPGGGLADSFESYAYDRWMGNLWQGDPSL